MTLLFVVVFCPFLATLPELTPFWLSKQAAVRLSCCQLPSLSLLAYFASTFARSFLPHFASGLHSPAIEMLCLLLSGFLDAMQATARYKQPRFQLPRSYPALLADDLRCKLCDCRKKCFTRRRPDRKRTKEKDQGQGLPLRLRPPQQQSRGDCCVLPAGQFERPPFLTLTCSDSTWLARDSLDDCH